MGNKPNILAVDDVPANLQVVGAILSNEGYDVHTVTSGYQALEFLGSHDVDLVLLDVMMPHLNGFETAKEIKKNPQWENLPIIFLTAVSDKDEVVQGFEVGGVDYVTKPFNKSELLIRVKTQITLRKTRHDLEVQNTKLERIAKELKEANLARDKFFSILAHDLKNPFSGLLSLMDEIIQHLDTFSQEDLLEIFKTLRNSSNNVYHLLLTLLDWGQTQTGGLNLKIQPLNLYPLIEELQYTFENSLAQKKIEFVHELGIPSVLADRETLATILRNLVSNAIKYTKTGGKIHISSQKVLDTVEITVRDTGVGIKPENMSKLFRLDTKMSTLGTDHESGTGLGLILCKEFVEKNHGSLGVESVWGQGTVFRVFLPMVEKQDVS